jgi:hypothetical protein
MGIKFTPSLGKLKYCFPLFCLPILFSLDAWAAQTTCSGSAPTVKCTGTDATVAVNRCGTGNATPAKTTSSGLASANTDGFYYFNCASANANAMTQAATNGAPKAAAANPSSLAETDAAGYPAGVANPNGYGNPSNSASSSYPAQSAANTPSGGAAAGGGGTAGGNSNSADNSLSSPKRNFVMSPDVAAANNPFTQYLNQANPGEAQTANGNPPQTTGQQNGNQAPIQQADAAAALTSGQIKQSGNYIDPSTGQPMEAPAAPTAQAAPVVPNFAAGNPQPASPRASADNTTNDDTPRTKADLQRDATFDGIKANQYKSNTFTPSLDDCKLSSAVDGKGGCSGMRNTMAVTAVTAKVASTIGSQAVQMIGQQSQQTAILNGGSIASIYQSSAKLSAQAAAANIGMGAVQVGMGMVINNQANQHAKEYKNTFHTLKYSGDYSAATANTSENGITITGKGGTDHVAMDVYNAAINSEDGRNKSLDYSDQMDEKNEARISKGSDGSQVLAAKQKTAISSATGYAHAAATEQNQAASDGHGAALTNFAQGGGAMVSGTFQYLQAKQMEKLYAQMANTPTVTAPGADPFAAPGAISGSNTITGTGTDGSTAAATAATPAAVASGGPLGAPLGNIPGGPAFGTPTDPGPQAAATPPATGGGYGGSAAGGIGTNAVPGSATDEKTAQYDGGRSVAPYEGTGGFTAGGSAGKGNNNDPSIDPKTLMAAMLDQMGQKKDDDQGVGIENFRAVASDTSAPMPAEENFFTRFHDDYQEFQRKGQVGL